MIFVTGGTGLVGSHLLLDLLKKGKKVRALKRPHSDLSYCRDLFAHYDHPALFSQIEWVDGDLLDYFSLIEAMRGIDEVYHSAAIISFRKDDAKSMAEVNARGTANMVDACLELHVKRLGYVSSIAALGRPQNGNGVIDESIEWKNSKLNTGYAISKFAAEREVWRGIAEGLEAYIVNPSIILGVADPKKSSPRLFTQVYNGLRFYPVGVNGFVDVKDVSAAMILLMDKEVSGERYILNGANLSYRELFTKIAEFYGKKPPGIRAGKLIMGIAWRAEKVKSFLTGKKPLVTRETALTSSNRFHYSSRKIEEQHSFSFRNMDETLHEYANYYKDRLSSEKT